MTSMQTETLSGHLYMSTYQEMIEHARQERCLQVSWTDENEPASLSVIDVQRHASEVHLQAYHLRGDCGLVLRTQSIFQIKDDA